MPPNFSKFQFKQTIWDLKELDRWIYLNLDSRYCIKTNAIVIDNKITNVVEVGFEDAKELTMFTLACPLLNRN